jgi:diaminopimelate decarboxylase
VAAGGGVLAATVLAREQRRGAVHLRVDVGRYRGLPEAALGIRYPYHTPAGSPLVRCVLAGPLGPRLDLLDRAARLPRLTPGDRVLLLQAGAYTAVQAAYASDEAGPRMVVRDAGHEVED